MRPLPRPTRRPARRTAAPAALALLAALALAGCSGDSDEPGGSSGSGSGSEESSLSNEDAVALLDDAVDATVAVDSLTVAGEAALTIDDQDLSLSTEGSVDYTDFVAGVLLVVDQAGETSEVEVRSDGTDLWVRTEGATAPQLPPGVSWLQGDADLLRSAETFTSTGLVGVVAVLRGAEEVEDLGTDEVDGVPVRRLSTTVVYADALEAAGDLAPALESSFSLTGDADQAELDIEVAVGEEDDVVRELDLTVEGGDLPVSGGYDLALSDIDEPVDPPQAPARAATVSGPQADRVLDQLVQ